MSANKHHILLTGASGQVGGDLLPLLSRFGEVVAPARAELNLADVHAVREFVRRVSPRWIINPAAYTAVDKAESEPELAHTLNAELPGALGEEAKKLGAAVVHFSTDYVFDGSGSRPCKETDPTGPLNVYGQTKLLGEHALAASGAAHIILRTSWVYSATGKNFLRTILKLAAEREQLSIVDDQHGAPTWSHDLALLTTHIVKKMEANSALNNTTLEKAVRPFAGTYHATSLGDTTWYGFAERFIELAQQKHPDRKYAKLLPTTTASYPAPARRPANSRLDCSRVQQVFGYILPNWQDSVAKVMSAIGIA